MEMTGKWEQALQTIAEGGARVYGNAQVSNSTQVTGQAKVHGNAKLGTYEGAHGTEDISDNNGIN